MSKTGQSASMSDSGWEPSSAVFASSFLLSKRLSVSVFRAMLMWVPKMAGLRLVDFLETCYILLFGGQPRKS